MFSYFDEIIKSAIKSVYTEINEKTEKFRKSFDLLKRIRKNYFEQLDQTISNVQIWGMDRPSRLTDIYIPTRLSEKVSRNFFIDFDREKSLEDIRLKIDKNEINVARFIEDNRLILILGGPGAGKTTFLSALALGHCGLCDKTEGYIEKRLFPIWIPMRSYSNPKISIKKIILSAVSDDGNEEIWPFLHKLIKGGKSLIIFDGLDEVPITLQSHWQTLFMRLKKNYPKCKIIISCRSGGLNVDFSGFNHAEVLPFGKQDVNLFIDNWFGETHSDTAVKLKDALNVGSRVRELTRNPLLLSLLCILYEHDMELPRHKVDLYSRCIEAMLVKWDTTRGFRRDTSFSGLSLAKRRRIFQRVAIELTQNDKTILPESQTISIVGKYIEKFAMEPETASHVLSELESHHGLLIKPAANVYSFSHLSFQDYFSAEFLTSTHQELNFLRKNWFNPHKHDTIVFSACLVEDATNLVKEMLTLADLRGRQNYPTISRRLIATTLLIKTLSNVAPMSLNLRHIVADKAIENVKYASDHFQITGLNLCCSFVNLEPRIRHTYFKQRPTFFGAILSLESLIKDIMSSNYEPLFTAINTALKSDLNYSSRALLAASLILKDPEIVLNNYRMLIEMDDDLPSKYAALINSVINELESHIV
ncbi:MAG: NACHT domain-containing protein [Proteobacteria bacterium]|nr:NACHT domain-containing protein [Pseudomonadota bacterium]MBU2552716.1 NACHT domain-containing protein [Pseudomonadota bacterium]